ncbi:MAG: hypothetical protein ACRERV_14580, partial [Methylococcales bacterium]
EQNLIAIAERVTGITDQGIGRSIDRPNAPKTARGQMILEDSAGVRLSLDNTISKNDWAKIFSHIWELVCTFGDEQLFFRVSEEDARGLFETKDGFATLTRDERFGRMDFNIKFATSVHSREARKEQTVEIVTELLQLPIIQQNPAAQWQLGDRLLKSHDLPGMNEIMPRPQEAAYPKDPAQEWTLMLQGEKAHTNPLDDDQLHIQEHQQQIEIARESKREVDFDAIAKMISHIGEHQEQQATKQAQAVMQQQLADSVSQGLGGALTGEAGGMDMGAMMNDPQEGGY